MPKTKEAIIEMLKSNIEKRAVHYHVTVLETRTEPKYYIAYLEGEKGGPISFADSKEELVKKMTAHIKVFNTIKQSLEMTEELRKLENEDLEKENAPSYRHFSTHFTAPKTIDFNKHHIEIGTQTVIAPKVERLVCN